MLDPTLECRAGRATLLRAVQTSLEPLLALATPGLRRPNKSHTTSVGSRNESDSPGAWTEPRQTPVLGQWNKQPRSVRGTADVGACDVARKGLSCGRRLGLADADSTSTVACDAANMVHPAHEHEPPSPTAP